MDTDILFQNSMTHNFLHKFRTNNLFLDTLLTMIFVSCFPYITKYGYKVFNKIYDYFSFENNYYDNSITLEGSITKNRYGEFSYSFTEYSRSIFWYINENIKEIDGLSKLIEVTVNTKRRYDEDTDSYNTDILSNLIINQDKDLKLNDNIYINIELVDKQEDSNPTKSSGSTNNGDQLYKTVTIILFTKDGTLFDVTHFLDKCLKSYKNHLVDSMAKNQLYFIMDDDDTVSYTEYTFNSNTTFDTIFFKDKDKIIQDVDFFTNNKEFYKQKGLARRYSLLLYGNHGSGKTSTIKCLANYTGRHIISINANLIKDKKMLEDIFYQDKIGKYTIPDEKKLYVLEEFDVNNFQVVKDRKIDYSKNTVDIKELEKEINKLSEDDDSETLNVTKSSLIQSLITCKQNGPSTPENKITLGDILQVLDGLKECEGRMLVITTNNIDMLDKALIRQGRINRQIKFGNPSKEDIINITKFYYDDIDISKLEKILEPIDLDKRIISAADIVGYCRENSKSYSDYLDNIRIHFKD